MYLNQQLTCHTIVSVIWRKMLNCQTVPQAVE